MIISNVQIAKLVADRGYDFNDALTSIDAGRSPEEEKEEISQLELDDIVYNVCLSFDCEKEQI